MGGFWGVSGSNGGLCAISIDHVFIDEPSVPWVKVSGHFVKVHLLLGGKLLRFPSENIRYWVFEHMGVIGLVQWVC
jgi:hypothetical protein